MTSTKPLPAPYGQFRKCDLSCNFQPSKQTEDFTSAQTRVVFSKIVRSAPNNDPILFLPQLVEYLQEKFRIPANLPMLYKTYKGKKDGDERSRDWIVSWYSPLSSKLEDTRLSLELVPLVVDGNSKVQDTSSLPSMAMIAVHKDIHQPVFVPMITPLFEDSERKIIRALDRGLDKFSMGSITGLTSTLPSASTWTFIPRDGSTVIQNYENNNDHDLVLHENPTPVLTTISTQEEQKKKHSNGQKADMEVSQNANTHAIKTNGTYTSMKTGDESASSRNYSIPSHERQLSDDFAVQAARSVANRRSQESNLKNNNKAIQQNLPSEEFAVQAAQEIAKQRKASGNIGGTTEKLSEERTRHQINNGDEILKDRSESQKIAQKMDGNSLGKRSASNVAVGQNRRSWSISSPKLRAQERKELGDKIQDYSVDATIMTKGLPSPLDGSEKVISSNDILDPQYVKEKKVSSSSSDAKRELHLKVVDDKNSVSVVSSLESLDIQEKPDDSTEVRRAKEAQRMMSEISKQAQDMSAEDLLKDILKFGEEKKREEEIGSGFVSGAFEKAKELLRSKKEKREKRKFKDIGESKLGSFQVDISIPNDSSLQDSKVLSQEEELRQIFQAGERLAEIRSNTISPSVRTLNEEQEQEVDRLLSNEKTVSSYARTLDDDLIELEIQINRNVGEDMDGPMVNPMFDILSGPEVYNPNVDPETAVNWPGALPGRKTVRLPKELDEAVRQAKFAADVIMRMREESDEESDTKKYFFGERLLSISEISNLKSVVSEAVKLGLLNDPVEYMAERSRLAIIVDELWEQPEERFREIAENYKDLFLSDNFVDLLRERLTEMADRDRLMRENGSDNQTLIYEVEGRHRREREILGSLVEYAQLLVKETRALGATLEAQQIEVIRSICKVAMDPSLQTEEETARALSDAVRDMRPLFDDSFVAYLKYAVAEEKGRLARAGVLDDPEHNQWLMVLQIVQQGVYAEIAKGINRYIEHIWYILRMETRRQRFNLLSEIINVMPTLDVRPFVQVVDNIASSLGDAVKGDIDPWNLGEMTNSLLQLHRDVHELLPPDRINEMAKDADEWAAKQRQRLLEQRNLTKKRLEQSREMESVTDAILKKSASELDRFD